MKRNLISIKNTKMSASNNMGPLYQYALLFQELFILKVQFTIIYVCLRKVKRTKSPLKLLTQLEQEIDLINKTLHCSLFCYEVIFIFTCLFSERNSETFLILSLPFIPYLSMRF